VILLDTHVLLWLVEGHDRLGRQTKRRIESEAGDIHLSAMSFWEIAMLIDKRRIALAMPLEAWMERLFATGGFKTVGIDPAIAADAGSLPDRIHGDPCDRMLIATARSMACPILTGDGAILDYAALGHVAAIDAGR
jgi:PIN domain nuclease of toxin-antitoxin system